MIPGSASMTRVASRATTSRASPNSLPPRSYCEQLTLGGGLCRYAPRSSIFPVGNAMNTAELIEKIEALPRNEREEAEKFVDSLRARRSASEARSLMERVRVRRESVLRRRGLLDSTAILRDVREHGA